jgi:hypothetical protein
MQPSERDAIGRDLDARIDEPHHLFVIASFTREAEQSVEGRCSARVASEGVFEGDFGAFAIVGPVEQKVCRLLEVSRGTLVAETQSAKLGASERLGARLVRA